MLYGEISAYILHSCITELALGPFGPQSSLNNRFVLLDLLLEASWGHLESSWKPVKCSWNLSRGVLRAPGALLEALGGILGALGGLLEPSWKHLGS